MTDPRFKGIDEKAELLFSCTVSPEGWGALTDIHDERVLKFYGTHPWYHQKTSIDGLEKILKEDRRAQVGEIGLDSVFGPIGDQMESFIQQLELAEKYGRIANIHMVRCENEMLKILRKHKVTAILHSFTGPDSYVRSFADCGCYFSISPRVHRKSEKRIVSLLSLIPEDRLLIETDSPDNAMDMEEHIARLSKLMSMGPSDLEQVTLRNSRSLLP